jgi:prephenate dehydrogenase
VLAYTLVDMLARVDAQMRDSLFAYAAGGFRDFTRIASSSPKMWHDIVRANKTNVVAAIDQYLAALTELRTAIASDDAAKVLDVFSRARSARAQHFEVLERAATTPGRA